MRRLVLLLVLFLAGCSTSASWNAGAPSPSPSASPSVDLGPPTRLKVPAIGVDTPLESLGLKANGSLAAPTDFHRAGWYAGGTSPGDVGPAVIAGHVDSKAGPAVFFRLRDLKVGDVVEVTRGPEVFTFRVVDLERYPKAEFPTDKVHGPTPDPELRLITCGGDFDTSRRSYVDNIVVYAVLVVPS